MRISYSPEAIERLDALADRTDNHAIQLEERIWDILDHLENTPEDHRVGATQRSTDPTTWTRTARAGDDVWVVVWKLGEAPSTFHVLAVEPTSSL